MRGIACTPDDLASEITVVRNELDQRDDSPFTLLYEELNSMAFVAHPYRIPTIGYKDDVEAVSPDVLLEYYNRFYHPDNAFIVAVGDFEPATAKQQMTAVRAKALMVNCLLTTLLMRWAEPARMMSGTPTLRSRLSALLIMVPGSAAANTVVIMRVGCPFRSGS